MDDGPVSASTDSVRGFQVAILFTIILTIVSSALAIFYVKENKKNECFENLSA